MKSTIKDSKEIESLFKTGKKIFLPELMIFYLLGNQSENKFLYTSKKGIGNAVIRNSIKRKLKEISQLIENKSFNIALIGNLKLLELKDYRNIANKIDLELNKKGTFKKYE